MNQENVKRPEFDKGEKRAFIIGGACMLILAFGGVMSVQQFLQSYFLGYVLWTGLALGSLGILLLHHLVSGAWGHIIQRMVEAGARTIPFMGILFIPVLVGMQQLYPWSRPGVIESNEVLQHKAFFLNVPFFVGRTVVYFGLWFAVAYWLSGTSRKQDKGGDVTLSRKMKLFSAPMIILFVLSVTAASVDWLMSLEPEWYSTIYGMMIIVGMVLTALSFCTIVLRMLADKEPFAGLLTTRHCHHLGNMMFAFTILWAYMAFSQFLIIWSGNLPEDNFWYVRRLGTGWNVVAVVLLLGHFFVPFLLLLSRKRKRYINSLARIAVLLFVMRLVDYFWLISPAFNVDALQIHWMDLVAPIAIGGIWIALFLRGLKAEPLIPLHDPRFAKDGFHVHDIE